MEEKKENGNGTWNDEFMGHRGEMYLQQAYARTTDFRGMVYTLPGRPPFMLHRDVAAIYQVETRVLMQQVQRNQEHFDEEMVFELREDEIQVLVSQNVISGQALGRGATAWAFTHAGANHTAYFLRSDIALQRSKQISKAFTHLEKMHVDGLLEQPGTFTHGLRTGIALTRALERNGFDMADAARLAWYRKAELTQREAAKLFGVGREKVQEIEKALKQAGVEFPAVNSQKRSREMRRLLDNMLGFKDRGLCLLKGGAL